MQTKSLTKALLILVALVCAYQLMYFIPTSRVEKEAEVFAQEEAEKAPEGADRQGIYKVAKSRFLDSISGEVVFRIPLLKEYTYSELKGQQLALGLDLKGGMSTVLQVDLEELLKTLAGTNAKDVNFIKAIENTNALMDRSQTDYISVFVQEYRKIGEGKSLASLFMRSEMLDGINTSSSDGEVERILRQKANETVSLTYNMLKERIDKLGVAQPNVSLDAARDLILVELPGVENPERAREYLQASAQLEFWDTYRFNDPGVLAAFQEADNKLAANSGNGDAIAMDTIYRPLYDSDGNEIGDTFDIVPSTPGFDTGGPLFSVFQLNIGNYPSTVMGVTERNKRNLVMDYLSKPEIRALFPRSSKFLWSRSPVVDFQTGKKTTLYELYMIKTLPGTDKAPLEGDVVTSAFYQPDPVTNQPSVSLRMDKRGARKWAEMTTAAANNGNREIAIVLDNEVVSAPSVRNPITGGSSSIEGNYTVQEANDFANILEVGKLPARTKIISESVVGPSLGAQNIKRSTNSLLVGFGFVLLFMIFYYGTSGIVSIIALFTNIIFIFGALSSIGTVLTLPGIAGIVLTIGMAVDANVIIFERVREELRIGKTLLASVRDGFNNSYSAIIDANVTTILVAVVLAYFGLGPIKGFAVVLIIGVLSSLLTAVLFGKLMIDEWTGKGRNLTFWTSITENSFANLNIDWIGKRKIGYILSGTVIVLGLASIFTRGFDLGVDFKGGYSYNVQMTGVDQISSDDLRTGLTSYFGSTPVVKVVDTENTFNIITSYLINDTSEEADEKVMATLHQGLQAITNMTFEFEAFKDASHPGLPHITSFNKVGPLIADDIKKSSFYAGIFALLLIFLYIFIRFNKWQYSLGAVAALFHDSLIVISIFSIVHGWIGFSVEIDQAFIAALLTVIGYSINDTVVVFDRIRENLGIYTNKAKDEVINIAINNTFSRTIITSFTTFMVVFILFMFGGGSIKGFAFALLIGIVVGTYSSVFIATPIVRDLADDLKTRTKEKKKGFSKATVKA
ncbi:MAG TPA: protein translocase subunit SecDF [Saprospiraceae bacterium]|nr:protein translocase subunit SecDF [Saprospiraceae bacterium]